MIIDCSELFIQTPYCSVMADKGFKIDQECTARRINLIVPPDHRGQSQMLSGQVLKIKQIAQLRILVEQVIRRLKCYRILSQELDLVSHVDDALVICSAIVNNMKPPIMKLLESFLALHQSQLLYLTWTVYGYLLMEYCLG